MKFFLVIIFSVLLFATRVVFAQVSTDSLPLFEKRDLHNSTVQTRGTAVSCGSPSFTIQIVSDSSYNGYELKCADGCTGFYTVNVTGGVGPFTFQWLGNGSATTKNNQSWTDVCDQNAIQVLVTDVGQSVTCAASHVLNVPGRLQTINFNLTPPSCFNTCDGTATHTPIFGVPPYTYNWTNGETTKDASNLCIGSTTLFITDQNGCQFDTTINITTPPPIYANVTVQEVTCNNACDGVLTSNPSGGTGAPFSYTWTNTANNSTVSTTATANGLCENNTYNLHLIDNSGCSIDTAITLQDKLPMVISVASSVDAQCANVCDGQVTLSVSGGTPPYVSYDWYQGTFGNGVLQTFSGSSVNNLCANTDYYVVVTDSDGCSDSLQITQLSSPPTINISETHTDNNCFGANNGTITLTVSGGVSASGNYTYAWTTSDGAGLVANAQNQTGLSGGTYQVTVTDDIGCQETASITIAEPTEIFANGTATDVTCFNLTDGTITLNTTGGAGGYSWTWTSTDGNFVDPGTESLTGLDSASYSVHIVDASGCFIDTTIQVQKPLEIFANATITPILCNGDANAQINLAPINGTGTYVYDWDIDGTGDFDDNQNQSNLTPNTYNVSIRDANGCQKDTAIIITEPLPLSITPSSTQPHCNQNDGSISVTVSGGTPVYSYAWTDASNNNIGNTSSISNLLAGCYDITVTDANNCTQTQQICITDTPPPTATLTSQNPSCFGVCDGSVTINISNGSAPYNTVWTSTDANFTDPNTDNITNLCAADYTLQITDADNCVFTQTVTLIEPNEIIANGVPTDATCYNLSDGSIDLTTTGGAGGFSWSWTSTDANFVNPNTEDLSNLDSASYSVHIVDANGCFKDTTIHISKPNEIAINGVVVPSLCNGDNTAQINISPVNGTGSYVYDWDTDGTGDFDDPQNLSNLSAGTYNLSIRDANGCQKDTAITVNEPPLLTLSTTNTQPHCNQSDGSITASASGGTPNYTYVWTDASNAVVGNTALLNNIAAGCYDIIVTDANNCTQTQQICITDQQLPTVTLSPVNASCSGVCDGAITIVISNGTVPYNTTWTSTDANFTDPNTDDIFNLCAADYTLNITDASGCTASQSATISEPQAITITGVVNDVLCNGGNSGNIDITATGGTVAGTYSYNWSGANAFTSSNEDINGLVAGAYTVVVTDDNNCTNSASFNVNEPTPITVNTSVINAQCNMSNGSITATVQGGTPVYNYAWSDANGSPVGANTNVIQNQPSGVYNLTVTDNNGCPFSTSATISDDNGPILVIDNTSDVTCNGANDGFINITATSNAGGISYSWTSIPAGYTSSSEDINLLVGNTTYIITVTDANGCQANQSVLINEPNPITITATTQDPLCNNGNDGSIDAFINGGTTPYTFDWDNDGTGDYNDTEDLSGLSAGTYVLAVLDNNNCPQSASFTLNSPSQINLSTSSTNSNCLQSDGSATVTAVGGASNFSYQWFISGQTSPVLGNTTTLANQPAGCYDVLVSDGNNCQQTATVCITDNAAPTLSTVATDVTCFGDSDGTISLSINGGQTPYAPITWTGNTPIAQGTLNATGLATGVYAVQVTDGVGCIATISDTINEPNQLLITGTITNPLCNGDANGSINVSIANGVGTLTYAWTGPNGFVNPATKDLSGLIAGQYCITVTDANGCSNSQCFTLNNPNSLTATTSNNPTDCINNTGQLFATATGGTPNYTYSWSNSANTVVATTANAINLPADTYTLTLTDANGCTITTQETIGMANGPNTIVVSTNDVLCFGDATGSIIVSTTGGTQPYTYDWDNLVGNNDPQNQNNLTAGTYILITTDAGGCSTTISATINQPNSALDAQSTVTDVLCNGQSTGSIDLTVSGGTPNYTYLWSNNSTTEDLNNLTAGTYTVVVTDNNGCTTQDTATIQEPTPFVLNLTGNDATCGSSNGSVNVLVTGATPNYTYSWTDVTLSQPGNTVGGNSSSVNALPAGSYQVLVTDNNGCKDSSIVSISNTNGPTVTANVSNALCYGSATGSIDITVNGTPNFSYVWTGPTPFTGATTEDIANIEAGTYTVSVTDGNNCSTNQTIVVGGPLAPITDNALVTNLTCYNDASGQIDLTISGGTAPYSVLWTGANSFSSNSEDLSGLSQGTYNLHIDDNNGCGYDNTIVVTEPDSIAILANTTPPTCGLTDGSISTSVSGGTVANGYNYVWTNITTNTVLGNSSSVNNIGAGNYSVVVTDDNGCSNNLTISISDVNAPPLSVNVTNVDCFGNATGAIDLTVGGTNSYTFDWDNDGTGDNNDTEDLSGLTQGTYNVVVNDLTTGCTASLSAIVTEPHLLTISGVTTDLNCFNDNSGSIDITVAGGMLPYSYDWDNLNTSNEPEDQTGLAAGNYSVIVTDNNGCTVANLFTLNEPMEIFVPATITNNLCNNQAMGSIDVTPINGVAPFSYTWVGTPPFSGSSNQDINNLPAGLYTLTIIDNNGCRKDSSYTITEPSPMTMTVSAGAANCNLNDGSVSVTVTGGTLTSPDYSYNWVLGGTTVSTTSSVSNASAGLYQLSVTDDNGCTKDTSITVNNINAPVITLDSLNYVLCTGDNNGNIYVSVTGGTTPYNYVWNPNGIAQTEDLLSVPSGHYILTVTDDAGCLAFYDTTLVDPTPISLLPNTADATCGDCNGGAKVVASGGVGSYSYIWSNNTTTDTITNMCAGIYPVTVTDQNGCGATINVLINNIGGPTGENISTTNVTCNGGNDGSITINAIGGVAPYTYFWPHNNSTSNTVSNLTAGIYIVQITDLNGCVRNVSITITEPEPIIALSTITPATCMNNDGIISLAITGGVSPISITWANGLGNNSSITNLSSGMYNVTLTDQNNCSANFSFNIPNVAGPSVVLTATDVLCNGDLTGTINSTVTNNVGTITYQWYRNNTILNGQNNSNLLNIGEGNYTVSITDNSTGCQNQANITISEPSALELAQPIITPASCTASCDGTALVTPTGGTLAYTYTWNNGETTQQATALCSGINTVTITDNNNCKIEQNILVGTDLQLTATITNTDAICGECNGESTIVPSGGSGSYSVLWADGTTNLSHTNLCAGVHPFSVIDNNGCSIQLQSIINNIGGPDSETIQKNDVTCNGGNDGSIIVSPSGGTLPYSFLWIPTGATTSSIQNLSAGTYYLEVTDSNHCTRVVPVTINEPLLPTVTFIIKNANCGNNDGEISAEINSINAPFTVSWVGPNGFTSTNTAIQNLASGNYSLTVTDANGCTTSFDATIGDTDAPIVTTTKTDVVCYGECNGTATVTALPTGSYAYDWGSLNNTTNSVTGLCEGIYTVEVTNTTTNCKTAQTVEILQPDTLAIEVPFVENPSCFEFCDGLATVVITGGNLPYSYNWLTGSTTESQTNLCVGDSKVIVTDAKGCTDSITITVTEPTEIIITIDSTINSECVNSTEGAIFTTVTGGTPAYSYNWSTIPTSSYNATAEDINNLLPTNYVLTVTDANNCIKMDTVGIDTLHIVIADAGLDTLICVGNCATLVGTGEGPSGITYEWFDEFGNSVSSIDTLTKCLDTAKVCPFVFVVSDAFCSDSDTAIVTVADLPHVDAGADQIGLFGSIITLGGNPTATNATSYDWSPTTNILQGEETYANPQLELVLEEDLVVVVVDTNGCVNSDTVHVKPLPDISFPNGFTPNDDGVNDYWQIDFIKEFDQSVVEIYNRWGELLFRSIGYNEPWDGIYKGKKLPVGTYYYIIELNDPNFPNGFTGPVTIMR